VALSMLVLPGRAMAAALVDVTASTLRLKDFG